MTTETYAVIQVSGGKFHRPKETTHERMDWLRPMAIDCSSIPVAPVNVFNAVEDALKYTGGRKEFLCRKCFKEVNNERVTTAQ